MSRRRLGPTTAVSSNSTVAGRRHMTSTVDLPSSIPSSPSTPCFISPLIVRLLVHRPTTANCNASTSNSPAAEKTLCIPRYLSARRMELVRLDSDNQPWLYTRVDYISSLQKLDGGLCANTNVVDWFCKTS